MQRIDVHERNGSSYTRNLTDLLEQGEFTNSDNYGTDYIPDSFFIAHFHTEDKWVEY